MPSLVEVCRSRALRHPHHPAYVYLNGDEETSSLTYADLDVRARATAAHLRSLAPPGARALLLYPSGLDFVIAFYGCLYAGIIAVPVAPLQSRRLKQTLMRLRGIKKSAQASLLLSDSSKQSQLDSALRQAEGFDDVTIIATDRIGITLAEQWSLPPIDSTSIAYLQYSSGSTGAPKGVMLTHEAVLHNLSFIQLACGLTPESRIVTWLPLFHDMGLIAGVLQPMRVGFRSWIMSPLAFVQRPMRWLSAISRYQATVSVAPNFAYELCLRRTTEDQRAQLDLRSWRLAMIGAEPIRPSILDRFSTVFASSGFWQDAFYPCYGLAEATLMVTGGPVDAPPVFQWCDQEALTQDRVVLVKPGSPHGRRLVSSGRTWPGLEVVVADPSALRPLGPDRVGEIFVSGPSVGAGYWNNSEETARTFDVRLAGRGSQPFLRTGDLGFLLDGQLFITGRRKDLIVIDGQNHYPQDIESTAAESHPAIRTGYCVAFDVDDGSREQLIVVAEVDSCYRIAPQAPPDRSAREANAMKEVMQAVRDAIGAQHGLQVHTVLLVRPGQLPMTSSGKIQRLSCRTAFLAGAFGDDQAVVARSHHGETLSPAENPGTSPLIVDGQRDIIYGTTQ